MIYCWVDIGMLNKIHKYKLFSTAIHNAADEKSDRSEFISSFANKWVNAAAGKSDRSVSAIRSSTGKKIHYFQCVGFFHLVLYTE